MTVLLKQSGRYIKEDFHCSSLCVVVVVLQPCHVVYTDFRPTPLQHYIYPAGGDGLFLVEDEKVSEEEHKWYHAKVLLKRFHLNGHIIGFHPQTQKLELHYMSP